MLSRSKFVRKNTWCTLEVCWNERKQLELIHPAGALVRISYGPRWISWTKQLQQLDGFEPKTLFIGRWSILFARAEMYSTKEEFVPYTLS
jgi:hypothetical protein